MLASIALSSGGFVRPQQKVLRRALDVVARRRQQDLTDPSSPDRLSPAPPAPTEQPGVSALLQAPEDFSYRG